LGKKEHRILVENDIQKTAISQQVAVHNGFCVAKSFLPVHILLRKTFLSG
jgi:hypothetical protein